MLEYLLELRTYRLGRFNICYESTSPHQRNSASFERQASREGLLCK